MDTTTYVLTGVFSISGRQPCGLFAKDGASEWLWISGLQSNSATGIRKDGLQWTAVSPTASGSYNFGVRIGTDLRGLSVSGNVDVGATGAVADAGTNQVWLVHVVADVDREKSVPVGQNPVATAVSADQKLAYVVNQNDGTVSIVDTNANSVVATVAVGATPSSIALSAKWWDVQQ